jgi:hypothetical protein
MPMASPTMTLLHIKYSKLSANVIMTAPMMKSTSEKTMLYFLPQSSLVGPAKMAPKKAPRRARLTTKLFSTVVISGHSSLK